MPVWYENGKVDDRKPKNVPKTTLKQAPEHLQQNFHESDNWTQSGRNLIKKKVVSGPFPYFEKGNKW